MWWFCDKKFSSFCFKKDFSAPGRIGGLQKPKYTPAAIVGVSRWKIYRLLFY